MAIIERDVTGGTCTNYGCDAKILLDGPFECLDSLQNYGDVCVSGTPAIDWNKLMAYTKREADNLHLGLEQLFPALGIDYIRGEGRIADPHTVRVGEQRLETEAIVIATGQRGARVDVPGKEYLHDSRDFLSLEEMPDRLVFLGAGIISLEFASMAVKLGRSVTVVAHGDRALRQYPGEYVDKLVAKMEGEGVTFCWNQDVSLVERTEGGYRVKTKQGLALDCDYILDATGRVANYEDLGLEALGIEASPKGILVDDHLRTAVPNIYASGDVVRKAIPKLTPTAEFESNYIASQLLGSDAPIRYPAVPNLVFTLPRVGQTGVTLEEARKHPERYRVQTFPYGASMLWLAKNEKEAEAAFIIDRRGYLAGATVYSSEAGVWLDFLTLLINRKLRGEDLKDMIFSFPTSTYALVTTLIPLLMPTGMQFHAVKFYEKGFATQGFAFGGEEGADKFDNSVRYRSCLTNYVIDTGDEVILVDTGVPKESPATIPDKDTVIYTGRPITDYVTALGKLGYTPDRVTKILVTHKHEDHTGELRSFPNAKIYISPEDADALGLTGENVVRLAFQDGPYYNFPVSERIAEGICMAHPGQQRRHRRGRGALLPLPRGPELHRRGHVRRQAVGGL